MSSVVFAPRAGPDRGKQLKVTLDREHHHRWDRAWAAKFVAKWEGYSPTAVLDTIAQPPVATAGFGHTGPDVHVGEHWSREKSLRVLNHDIAWAAAAVAQKVTYPLTVRQRMALISFVFNLGPGVLEGDLLDLINKGAIKRAAGMMLDYDHAGGVVIEGLSNRRHAEAWMMLHPLHPRNPHKPKKKNTKGKRHVKS